MALSAGALSCGDGSALSEAPSERAARLVGPLGGAGILDFRHLPALSDAVLSRQVSSYDRTGCNMDFGGGLPYGLSDLDPETLAGLDLPGLGPECRTAASFEADNSVLYEADGRYVIADVEGPGLLTRIWMTFFDTQNTKSAAALPGDLLIAVDEAPERLMTLAELFSGAREDAPFPLVAGPERSGGGHIAYLTIPFEHRLRISSDRPLEYYQVGYYQMAPEVWLERFGPGAAAPSARALAGALADPDASRPVGDRSATASPAALGPGQTTELIALAAAAPSRVIALEGRFAAPVSPASLRDVWLSATFDGAATPAIEAPLGMVFGVPEGGGIRSWPVESDGQARFALHFPMPFAATARFALENRGRDETLAASEWTASYEALEPDAAPWGYLEARYRSEALAADDGRDYVLLDVTGRGHVVGTVLVMGCDGDCSYLTASRFGHLEGDERIRIDGARWPALHGTGAEDYFNSGWYFLGGPYGLPTHGHTALGTEADVPGVTDRAAAYRWHLTDPIVFQHDLRFALEHGPTDNAPVRFESLVWFYARPEPAWDAASDAIDLSSAADRNAHGYHADDEAVSPLTSVFPGPSSTDPLTYEVHRTRAAVRFTLTIPKANAGVRLRRLFDAEEGGQRATVRVNGSPVGEWAESDLNPYQRWAESDFEIDSRWTTGRAHLEVTLEPQGDVDWTAARYEAFVYREPGR